MNEEQSYIDLVTLGHGAAGEQFAEEFAKALKNIQDTNTSPTKARTITLKLTLKPNEERNVAGMGIECKSSLAPTKPYASQIFIGREDGQLVAVENAPPEQLTLFPEQQGLKSIEGAKK